MFIFRQKNFSLIEILVVMGSLIFFISLALPTLVKSRAMAKSVGCRSNLRQMFGAVASYGGETGYYIQGYNHLPAGWTNDTDFTYTISSILGKDSKVYGDGRDSRSKIFECPASARAKEETELVSSYACHGRILYTSERFSGHRRYNDLVKPDELIIIADAAETSAQGATAILDIYKYYENKKYTTRLWYSAAITVFRDNDDISGLPSGFRYRHKSALSSTNILLADGAVRSAIKNAGGGEDGVSKVADRMIRYKNCYTNWYTGRGASRVDYSPW